MRHLLISREFPPATYARGGIGTYLEHVVALLVERGETVHVIGERWDGAPHPRQALHDGRLVIHRVSQTRPLDPAAAGPTARHAADVLEGMSASAFPAQSFAWQAALLAESLAEAGDIDIIEAQDYEAPLYYFLKRRALGLGPRRQPPCVVHLHSPWEFVCHYNGWGLGTDYDLTIKRLEDDAIAAADAVLCPSDYLARQAEVHYGLATGSVERIPYPTGDMPFVERSAEVWERGTVAYVGRLEPRKGVLEWIDAAVRIAASRPGLHFELIGADTSLTGDRESSMRAALEGAIPPGLRASFAFAGALPPAEVRRRLARARVVAVPSRWENFPLVCIEAMSSGVPVLASPHGGMAEMIEDGRTGWIAASGSAPDLAAALERALEVPAAAKQEMGRAAAAAIRVLCDNRAIIDRQLAFKRQVVERGAGRSLRLPMLPPWTPPSDAFRAARAGDPISPSSDVPAASIAPATTGIGLLIVDVAGGDLAGCLQSIAAQTSPPSVIALASAGDVAPSAGLERAAAGFRSPMSIHIDSSIAIARIAAIKALLESAATWGIAVADTGCRLAPDFVSSSAAALTKHPNLGLVSSWYLDRAGGPAAIIRPNPGLPYQWLIDDVAPCFTIRTEAVRRLKDGDAADSDALVAAVLAGEWQAVTYPDILCTRANPGAASARNHERLQNVGADHFNAGSARLAGAVALRDALVQARTRQAAAEASGLPRQVGRGPLSPATIFRLPLAEQLAVVGRAIRHPGYALEWLAWHGRRVWAKSRRPER